MAAPLFYSGDMSQLDEFTLNVLCNPEVIEVDQDPLGDSRAGCQADRRHVPHGQEHWKTAARPSAFAIAARPGSHRRPWSDVGVTGKHIVRDLWRQKNLGVFQDEFRATVPRHGVVLVRLRPPASPDAPH